jgi:hypothetical protein
MLTESIAAKEPKAESTKVSSDRAHIVLPVEKDGQLLQVRVYKALSPIAASSQSVLGHPYSL